MAEAAQHSPGSNDVDAEPEPVSVVVAEPLRRRAQVACGLIGAVVVAALVSLWVDIAQLDLLNRAFAGERVTLAEAQASDDRVGTAAIVYTILTVLSAITFLLWYSRAYRNIIGLGVGRPRYGPRWAVAYWFIPIVAAFRPKQVMNDIWRGSNPEISRSADGWQSGKVNPLLHWWWAAWLLSVFVWNLGTRTTFGADPVAPTPDEIRTEATAYVAADVTDVIAGVLAILVIRKITDRQAERYRRAADQTLPPDPGLPPGGRAMVTEGSP